MIEKKLLTYYKNLVLKGIRPNNILWNFTRKPDF